LIEQSWSRCRAFGLEQSSTPQFDELSGAGLQHLLESRDELVQTTHREVLPYYEHILGNSNCVIRLADHQGRLLKDWGAARPLGTQRNLGFRVGARWLENTTGTNAIGTALACGQAVHIEHDEHFLSANRFIAGSASPIHDAHRQVIAVLDVSSDSYLPPSHTLGLVKMMSQTIENRLILNAYQGRYLQLTFNTAINNLDSHWAGLLIIDDDGLVLAANRRADSLLGLALPGMGLQQLFGVGVDALLEKASTQPFSLPTASHSRLHCLLKKPYCQPVRVPVSTATDAAVDAVMRQGARLLAKDVPLLISGETGSGKEMLVKALHRDSSRAGQPLVAVNCAAIPSELVESELFGYERGAFTGASHKGNQGLIRKADGGILFLDEIGDMPLPTQARLLRVLQERCIQPLGSGEPIAVDIRVISATHQDLREQVKRGLFREDLYYRLAPVTLRLPPLRERSDKAQLIREMCRRHAASGPAVSLSDAALQLLLTHPWPGNLRQLNSVLQVAIALAEGPHLDVEDLPADFFVDLPGTAPLPPTEPMISGEVNLEQLLRASNGNISHLAKRLGLSRNTVYKRLRELNLTN